MDKVKTLAVLKALSTMYDELEAAVGDLLDGYDDWDDDQYDEFKSKMGDLLEDSELYDICCKAKKLAARMEREA